MTDPLSRINALREAVPVQLRQIMPKLRSCEALFGRLNLDELETLSAKTPAVFFSVTDMRLDEQGGGHADLSLSLATFALTDGREREKQAWAIAEAIALSLPINGRWGLANITVPGEIKVAPVLGTKIAARGVSVIAVSWKQVLTRAGTELFNEDGTLLEELYVNGDQVDLAESAP